MCGIAGIVNGGPGSNKRVQAMLASISHRGPDGQGVVAMQGCVLGHQRLSIVDLEGGIQPMLSENEQLGVTFNGEIYGYKELKKHLVTHHFKTHSDTEVLLAAYEKWGESSPAKLNGMFAFAVWDNNSRVLLAARDRFGEKPFYYAIGAGGEFVFSSEIKGVLASGLIKPTICRKSLGHYMQKLYVPTGRSIYDNVFELPPAHSLIFKEGKVEIIPYWQSPAVNEQIHIDEAAEEFKFLLDQAVRRQLIADVEVGAFLSGGLDSTTIVTAASNYAPEIQTFSFVFPGAQDESKYARLVASKIGSRHTELIDDDEPLGETILKMATVYDEPFADSSNVASYRIFRKAREKVKVALSGDGGDELLGGYTSWYRPLFNAKQLYDRNIISRNLLVFAARVIRKLKFATGRTFQDILSGYDIARGSKDLIDAHWRQLQYFNETELSEFDVSIPQRIYLNPENNALEDVMLLDTITYLPGDILRKVDRASMAHGLEVRAPFLDVDLAEFCLTLPARLKVTKNEDKAVMRKAFSSTWPDEIRVREKQGFGAPIAKWLTRPDVQALKNEYFENRNLRIYGLLPESVVKKYSEVANYKTWILLTLSIWAEQAPY